MFDIYVINLLERIDRKTYLIKIFSKYKNINLIFVEAIKHKIGTVGCFMSHQKCINIAKEKNLDKIIVIEDDCLLLENFEERFNLIFEFLEKNNDKWDIFLGGVNETKVKDIKKKIIYNDNTFFYISRGTCSHFIIYNKSSYHFFLSKNVYKEINDTCWFNKLRALVIVPFLAYQLPGFSNIKSMKKDYINLFKNTEKIFLEYKTNDTN